MYNLAESKKTEIKDKEIHLIALALDTEPNELHQILFSDLKLPAQSG